MTKAKKDFIAAIVLVGISVAYFGVTFFIEGENFAGPRLMPQGLGCVFVVLTLLNLLENYRAYQTEKATVSEAPTGASETGEEDVQAKSNYRRVVLTLLSIAVYAFIMPRLGFVISSALFLFVMISLLATEAQRKHVVKNAAAAVIGAAAIYGVFRYVFVVVLPTGMFGF